MQDDGEELRQAGDDHEAAETRDAAVATEERDIPGACEAERTANAQAKCVTGATSAPEDRFKRRPGETTQDYLKRLQDEGLTRPASREAVPQKINDLEKMRGAITSDPQFPAWQQNVTSDGFTNPAKYGDPLPSYMDANAGQPIVSHPAPYTWTGADGKTYQGNASTYPAENSGVFGTLAALSSQHGRLTGKGDPHWAEQSKLPQEVGPTWGAVPGMPTPGIYTVKAAPLRRTHGSLAPSKELPKANPSSPAVGEPVSVVNGEYLETWRDFLIPGTFSFDGARYMGLKLGLPEWYESPLGPCQISMFDEIFSNPEAGQLLFHDAQGKRIGFDRPFNFLPSTNTGYPGLELKAPWLKQLTLKDGPVTRHFRQYEDKIYRLEKIDDLNGFELVLHRSSAGLLERAEGADGLSLAFQNDPKGRRTGITLIGTDGSQLELAQYAYDERGRMTSADCAFGMSVRYAWQAERDLLGSWHDITRASVTRFTYDETGRVIHTATNGIWDGDRFDYQDGETGYLPGGSEANTQRFLYDENQNVTAEIDALGGTVSHTYNHAGFRTETMDANGNAARTRYDSRGNVGETIDAEGRATTYIWGDDDELHLVMDGAGNRKRYEHDTRSNVIAETDAEGHVTRLSRDERGRVIATEFPNGSVERRDWDDFNRIVCVTDAKGGRTTFEYDAFNRLITTSDALGQVTRREYHAGAGGFDMPSHVTRPDGVCVSHSFDAQGQLASVTDGEGRAWTYRNGAFGILQAITDPKGGVISFDYDIEGRIVSVTNAVGCIYSYVRDAAGRVIAEEDFDGRVIRYTRDAAGQVTEKLKPDGARITFAYDKSGLVKRIQSFDAKGAPEDLARFWYDGRGLLVRAENTAALVEFQRDRNGRITAETLNGKRIASKRDAMGDRILREMIGLGGGIVEYVRDPLGAVEKMVAGEAEIVFRRDALGRETRREIGGFGLAQRYDAAGQLVAQTAGPKSPVDLGISRLGWSVPSGEGQPKRPGTIARIYDYDRAFAPVRIDDGLWGETRFDYDDNGQLVSAEGARGSERFAYDAARNLAGASASAPFLSESAGYGPGFDATFGSVTPTGRPSNWQRTLGGVVQIARGPNGERIRLTHDDCGRLLERRVERDGFRPQRWRYRWDAHDRMVAVTTLDGDEWLFGYDPFGRRVSKVRRFAREEKERAARIWPTLVGDDGVPVPPRPLPGEADTQDNLSLPVVGTAYLWDGDHMVAEAPLRLDGHIAWEAATGWLFHENSFSCHRLLAKTLLPGMRLSDGTVSDKSTLFPIVCDQLGTPKEMFDVRGDLIWAADHHVWGAIRSVRTYGAPAAQPAVEPLSDAAACPWRFPGQYADEETGLYYNRHRYYDPLAGQYASPDPIGLSGGDKPQGYVDNPTVWTDLLGLKSVPAPFVNPNRGADVDSIVSNKTPQVYDPNTRYITTDKMNDKQFKKLVTDVKDRGLGDKDIIVVKRDSETYVVWGNNRMQAAKQAGITDQLRIYETELPFRGYRLPEHLSPISPPRIR